MRLIEGAPAEAARDLVRALRDEAGVLGEHGVAAHAGESRA
jgi:hypothetical protein